MAAVVPRLLYPNLIWNGTSLFSVSSQQTALPVDHIRDQLRSKVWRSKSGWNVTAGFNNKFDFIDNGVAKVATLTVGNYPTGALYAAMVQAAMNATAGITNTYGAFYNSANNLFTLARVTGSNTFGIELSSVDFASAAKDLGFVNTTDKTGLTTYDSEVQTFHSREWLKVDLGSAIAPTAAIVINHNVTSIGAGGITLQGNNTDAWTAPLFTQALTGDAALGFVYPATSALQWWRLVINDAGNPAGYSEIGVWFLGTYGQTSVAYTTEFKRRYHGLSQIAVATHGANFVDLRPQQRVFTLTWEELANADRDIIRAFIAATPRGKNFFFAFSAVDDPTDIRYCFLGDDVEESMVPGTYYTFPFLFVEALG